MFLNPKRPAEYVIHALGFLLVVVFLAGIVVEVGGSWSLGALVGVLVCAGLVGYMKRPLRVTRYIVSSDGTSLHLTCPDGEHRAIAWAHVHEVVVSVEGNRDAISKRTWLVHADDQIPPVAIPELATGVEALEEWVFARGEIDKDAVWADEPGVHVVWSKAPGWTPPPQEPPVIVPSDPRNSIGEQWLIAYGFSVPAAATVFVVRSTSGSSAAAAIAALAWATAIWLAARRNHPGIGYRVDVADGRITLHGPGRSEISIPADDVREIAFETRLSFLHGYHRFQILQTRTGGRLEVANGTAGSELLEAWSDSLPGHDIERFGNALFNADDDPPGVRRVAWSRD